MEASLSIALTFLTYTGIILGTILVGFLIALIVNVIELVKSYTRLSETVQKEIQPTLEEVKKALEGINGLATGVDKQITSVKNSFGTAYNFAYGVTSKIRSAVVKVAGGIVSGIKFLLK